MPRADARAGTPQPGALSRARTLAGLVYVTATAACTQNFDQFEPINGFEGSSVTSGSTAAVASGTGGGLFASAASSGAGGEGGASSSTSTTAAGGAASSSSVSSASSASASSASASGAGGSGGASGEDCLDGADDDGDGAADCADTDCGEHACVPLAPEGWTGPVALYDGPTASAPSCGGAFPMAAYEGHDDLVPEPASCTACACAAPVASCELAPLELHAEGCPGAGTALAQPAPKTCTAIDGPAQAYAADAPKPAPGASCEASGGELAVGPPQWEKTGRTCGGATSAAGCAAGEVCAPKPAAPFAAGLCIYKAGLHACPATYPEQHVFVDDVIDTRGCTPCSCAPPGSVSCAATSTVFEKANCVGKKVSVPNDGTCVKGLSGKSFDVTVTVTAGPCQPLGGDPFGSIVESANVTTVCCAG